MIQSDDLLKAIETAIPATAIEQAITTSKANEERNRSLPAHLVVCLVVAMSLWSRDSMRDVLKNLLEDGSYLSWINPSGKLRSKGCQPILVRVIEYTIEHPENPTEQLTYRLITNLLDIDKFPAELLAKEYHQRWEVENIIDELKIHLLGRKTHVRSQKPREVVQEIYGWLLGHWSVRVLMFQAATTAGVPPLRLSFTSTLRVIRRAIPKFQDLQTEDLPFFSIG
ncbi:hypothetical protein NSMS1_04530 [Nostoc sp. MS1]|nr:hypothetical protein NSMS1_04530 [Nostoc sp. MS1]